MKNVLFYQDFSPLADICTVALAVILFWLLRSNFSVKKKNLHLFLAGDICVILAAICHSLYHILLPYRTADSREAIWLIRTFSMGAWLVTFAIFCIYIRSIFNNKEKNLLYLILSWAGVAVYVVEKCISHAMHYGFYIDSGLLVHESYYLESFHYIYLYYAALMFLIIWQNRRRLVPKMYICLRRVVVLAYSVMAVQFVLRQCALTSVTFAFIILTVLFLFHYYPYDIATGMLDSKVFQTYVHDFRNRFISMVWITIEDLPEIMSDELSEVFYHLNMNYFKECATFQLKEDKLVLVYDEAKNENAKKQLERLTQDFEAQAEQYQFEYKMVLMHSDISIEDAESYYALEEMLRKKMKNKRVYRCEESDIESFHNFKHIVSELRDINNKGDLEDDRVLVFCQPILNTQTQTFRSAEALMRLKVGGGRMIFPDMFIPIAEEYDYIHMLSKIILHKTCKQIRRLQEEGYLIDRISVNFSMKELRDGKFCDEIIQIIEDNGISYDKIGVELTESMNETEFENAKRVMTQLHAYGLKFYLDDFGTGYSNFARIMQLPVDIIKFDRSLTIMAGEDDSGRNMVGSFSDIFKKEDYTILFEGIEDEEDELRCTQMSALYLQGYKYSRPIPIEKLDGFLEQEDIA